VIEVLAVAGAGAVGAPSRLLLDQWVTARTAARTRARLPWGTFVVNLSGAFVLGLVTGLGLYDGLAQLPKTMLGAGFCGAYTTFSTFSYETVRLVEDGAVAAAVANVAGSLVVGLLAAAAGLALAVVV
jgi:CrcB protein